MIKNQYTFPRIDDLFYQMKGVTMFSNIELRSGYHQLLIKEEYISNIAFKTRFKHYEFTILPFRMMNAPEAFMIFMNGVFCEYLNKFVKYLLMTY
jgi:hypothetical protein